MPQLAVSSLMTSDAEIRRQYSRPNLFERIMELLQTDHNRLSALDEFHLGGNRATQDFFSRLGFQTGMKILDIGSGLGGPARHAAREYGLHVTGIDLTPEFVDTSSLLSKYVKDDGKTLFQCASAVSMPFLDKAFDAAYTIHAAMNIEDKKNMLAEVNRVLKPGSIFGLYDVLAGPDAAAPIYPLPWADQVGRSFLVNLDNLSSLLQNCGFVITQTHDATAMSVQALERLNTSPELPGLHLLLGDDFRQKTVNLLASLKSGALASYMIVSRKCSI